MDNGKVEPVKIIQILPGLEEGGVERHVLWLSNELASRGHEMLVVSSGGKLEGQFEPSIKHWRLPVHLKNPLTAAWCAIRIANRARKEGWDLLHAHSRVPVWIAWWASFLADMPWIITAHDNYRTNMAIYPFRYASAAICVSGAVKEHLEKFLPKESHVIYNGLPRDYEKWEEGRGEFARRFLFLGRLTRRKGLHIILEAFGELRSKNWVLDVVGNGSLASEMQEKAQHLKIADKVNFWGFRDDTEKWMKRCDCFLFPSLDEGMGLTLMQAIYMRVPVIASDLPAVRELSCDGGESLVSRGNVGAWKNRIESILNGKDCYSRFDPSKVRTVKETTDFIIKVYQKVLGNL